jgi:predicted nucleic acid-binding protein
MNARPLIIDASILVKALDPEAHSREARALLASRRRLLAPDLMPIELGNILWKKVQRGAMGAGEALEALESVAALAPIRILSSAPYHPRALGLALTYGRSFYDSLYLALAQAEAGVFVTADERLVNAMATTPLADHLHWIGQGEPSSDQGPQVATPGIP